LTFGNDFNQPLEIGAIPNNVKYLTFGNNFNQILKKGIIPDTVKSIVFGHYFNQELSKDILPNNITNLSFGKNFNQFIEIGAIPKTVTNLIFFNPLFNQILNDDNLPSNLVELLIHESYNMDLLKCEKNVFIGKIIFERYNENNYSIIINDKMKIETYYKDDIKEYIDQNMTNDKLIGHIILEELAKKVFHPKRLMKISNDYNIDFDELVSIY
jgi:hypothetical protein